MTFNDFLTNIMNNYPQIGNAYMGDVTFSEGLPEGFTRGTIRVTAMDNDRSLLKFEFNCDESPYEYTRYAIDGILTEWSVGGGGTGNSMVVVVDATPSKNGTILHSDYTYDDIAEAIENEYSIECLLRFVNNNAPTYSTGVYEHLNNDTSDAQIRFTFRATPGDEYPAYYIYITFHEEDDSLSIETSDVSGGQWGDITGTITDQLDLKACVLDLIPAQATNENQLADKDFVNSSIATNTAYFRGTYDVVSDLGLTINASVQQIASAIATKLASLGVTPTNNDYVFVSFPDATVSSEVDKYDRYKYTLSDNVGAWGYEYTLNNSSFTSDQWKAINSGITSAKVTQYDGYNQRINAKQDILTAGSGIIISGSNVISATGVDNMISITYESLVTTRNGNKLIPGMQYRINDYECTVNSNIKNAIAYTDAAFDVIVVADDMGSINENARCCKRATKASDYYEKNKLEAWEIKYCLDNDTNRFEWADTKFGKGVIYWMKDEFGNEAPYDFKGIKFVRYELKGSIVITQFNETTITSSSLTNSFFGDNTFEATSYNEMNYPFITGFSTPEYATGINYATFLLNDKHIEYFTFSAVSRKNPNGYYNNTDILDASLYGSNLSGDYLVSGGSVGESIGCFGNKIEPCYDYSDKPKQILNNIVFLGVVSPNWDGQTYSGLLPSCNTIGSQSKDCTFGFECHNNKIGSGFVNNYFAGHAYDNVIGNDCIDNIFGDWFSNSFIGNQCGGNIIDGCSYINFSGTVNYIILYNVSYIEMGAGCSDNIIQTGTSNIRFKNGCYCNIISGHMSNGYINDGVHYCNISSNSDPKPVTNFSVYVHGKSIISLTNVLFAPNTTELIPQVAYFKSYNDSEHNTVTILPMYPPTGQWS